MENNFTQGNWTTAKSGHDWLVYSENGDGRDIAIVRGCKTEEEAEANAKLIANAKELFLALEAIMNSNQLMGVNKHLKENARRVLDNIKY